MPYSSPEEALDQSAEFADVGIYDQACLILEEALETDPGNLDLLVRLAYYRLDMGEGQVALHLSDRIELVFPNTATGLRIRAAAYQQLNRLDEALEITEEGLAHEPDDTDLLAEKIWTLSRLGREEEALAVAEYSYALLTEPDWNTLFPRAALMLSLRPPAQALEAAEALHKAYPDDSRALTLLAHATLANKRADEAARLYRLALQQDHNNGDAHQGLTQAILQRNKAYQVLQSFDAWLKARGVQNQFWFWIGVMFAVRLVRRLLAAYEAPTWLVAVVVVPIAVFALASWYVPGLMLFTLLLDPYGRQTLTRRGVFYALLMPVGLGVAAALAALGFAVGSQAVLGAGGALALVLVPIYYAFISYEGQVFAWRNILAAVAGASWLLLMAAILLPASGLVAWPCFVGAFGAAVAFMWIEAFKNRQTA